MNHVQLVHEAMTAIDRVFSDTTVDKETTRESLRELVDELEMKLETLEN